MSYTAHKFPYTTHFLIPVCDSWYPRLSHTLIFSIYSQITGPLSCLIITVLWVKSSHDCDSSLLNCLLAFRIWISIKVKGNWEKCFIFIFIWPHNHKCLSGREGGGLKSLRLLLSDVTKGHTAIIPLTRLLINVREIIFYTLCDE